MEVFRVVCQEQSYSHAALELRSTRANIKRVCAEFEKAVGRPVFEEGEDRTLRPTAFARGLLAQMGPLAQALRRLSSGVRCLHESGRILRFAAAGEFFRGGLFTDFLGRLQISNVFRPCYMRMEVRRFRPALLNAECDVYFGAGIKKCERLEQLDLGPVSWRMAVRGRKEIPREPADLPQGRWWVAGTGDPEPAEALLREFYAAGAPEGGVFDPEGAQPDSGVLLYPNPAAREEPGSGAAWPCYRFSANLRKNHPYTELQTRLAGASTR